MIFKDEFSKRKIEFLVKKNYPVSGIHISYDENI
jgi:hypothetical protein